MQNYKVTVNGKVYEVTVEETSQSAAATSSISSPAEKPITSKPGTAEAGDITVNSPLAGSIMSIKVKPGDEVKYGQVLLTLEALKMENEIVAPEAGVVKEIFTQTGAMVNVGDLLVSLRSL
ncbi:MAG TPA: biotin/lipoyl-binding protein [Bacillota bacterium]|nr:biotin/lipoyl-binding protein [Bacillota bacterium]HOL09986.1 biotin/lipoyl-binding protein [Bacillota bacterium]HPO97735.1 biotin/lipoyl-binding protein [Bacillota bacterium]